MRRRIPAALLLSATLALAACASEPAAVDAGPPSWARVQAIFAPRCNFAPCHGGVAGSLTLTGPGAYAALVGAPSFQVARVARVAPGDPAGSYLMLKLEGQMASVTECAATPRTCGVSMPQGEAALPAAELAVVRAWIAAGAPE
ncbi:MAG: hypothetical protein JWM10_3281 [Myxococcaceae bacterium]|nr:hypothetical protein [Myxococcaceae bacterium]